jgi:telomere length regulation protein
MLMTNIPPAYWKLHLRNKLSFPSKVTFFSKMEGLLTEFKAVKHDPDSFITPAVESQRAEATKHDLDPDHLSSRHIIDLLKSNPDREQLSAILAFIDPFSKSKATRDFDLRLASPITAQILQLLVSTTIPTHWGLLNAKESKGRDAKSRAALLRCLSSVSGLGSLVAQLRTLTSAARASAQQAQGSSSQLGIRDILAVLAALLEPKDLLLRLYSDMSKIYDNQTRQQVAWRELVSLVAGGKVLSTAAEAMTVLNNTPALSISWVGNGSQYALWLGRNISHLAIKLKPEEESDWASLALLTGRALSIGYTGQWKMILRVIIKLTLYRSIG